MANSNEKSFSEGSNKDNKCVMCNKCFHAETSCMISLDTESINADNDICHQCADKALPFRSLTQDEYTESVNPISDLNQNDMDRLNQLKFNPFQYNDNVALSENNSSLDTYFDLNMLTCNYVLPNEFKNQNSDPEMSKYLSLLHPNLRSIANKFDTFKNLLNTLGTNKMKIIGITETWLNDSNKDNFELDGYKFININRTNKRGGGVGIYIANELQYKTRNDLNINTEDVIETVFIEIEMPTGKNVIAGVIYRPPNSNIELFLDQIQNVLDTIDKENKICYLMGDFNIDLLKSFHRISLYIFFLSTNYQTNKDYCTHCNTN